MCDVKVCDVMDCGLDKDGLFFEDASARRRRGDWVCVKVWLKVKNCEKLWMKFLVIVCEEWVCLCVEDVVSFRVTRNGRLTKGIFIFASVVNALSKSVNGVIFVNVCVVCVCGVVIIMVVYCLDVDVEDVGKG